MTNRALRGIVAAVALGFGFVAPLVAQETRGPRAQHVAPVDGKQIADATDVSGRETDRAAQNAPTTTTERTTAPEASATVEPPAKDTMTAVVIEASGTVDWAPVGVSVLAADGWTAVKLGDRLASGTQVRTGLRSYVNLQFGSTTTIAIRSATHSSIDQCYRSATAEVVRMGLGYGTVRGGSTEGEVRSDVIIDSTVATLAKRGTDGWQIQVEPNSGRFRISLAREGLVEARKKLLAATRTSRTVRPGEYATDRNIANMWIKQDIFDRNVQFFQAEGLSAADAEFTIDNTRGYAVVSPGGGSTVPTVAGRVSSDFVLSQLDAEAGRGPDGNAVLFQPVSRPEGNFGTGDTFRILRPQSSSRTALSDRAALKRDQRHR